MKLLPWKLVLVVLLLGSTGCTSHYSTAILLQEHHTGSEIFRPARRQGDDHPEGNTIYIGENTKFSVEIKQILPGWLHRPNMASRGFSSENTELYDHFMDKELWLLTTIRSKSPSDLMELQSKQYFKASNVKFESAAFSALSLDNSERVVFTHTSDSAYTIAFEIYEVDGFAVKRELAAASQNPGISGIIVDATQTGLNVLGAVAGDYVTSRLKKWTVDPMAIERLLLKQGAVLEFSGTINILRDDEPGGTKLVRSRDFFLLDYFKSQKNTDLDDQLPNNNVLNDREKHANKLEEFLKKACISKSPLEADCFNYTDPQLSYIELSVLDGPADQNVAVGTLDAGSLKIELAKLNEGIRKSASELNKTLDRKVDGNSIRGFGAQALVSAQEEVGDISLPELGADAEINNLLIDIQTTDRNIQVLNALAQATQPQVDEMQSQMVLARSIMDNLAPQVKRYQQLKALSESEPDRQALLRLLKRDAD